MPPTLQGHIAAEVALSTKLVRAIEGRFLFSDRPTAAGANPVYRCRTQSLSPGEFTIAASTPARVGETFTAVFDRLGPINGTVTRLVPDGFVVAITASDAERRSLAATISWLKKRHTNHVDDHRAAPRYKTRGERCTVRYADGSIECRLRDISATGASLASATLPPVQTEVRIGNMTGRVVRHAAQGFGVHFEGERTVAALLKDLLAEPD